jgi:acetolactate synthase-1/2/3 large subunit
MRLEAHGVDYLFANAGTDFPSIVEALARRGTRPNALPTAIVCPHENAAMSMAHGYCMVSGQPQAVMVHVNVGTANALCGLMNAHREQIPVLLMAGRTPILEQGAHGSRTLNIHWAQEMFDQGGMVREFVKWDYELRDPRQVATVVDRALAVAKSDPRGPVYLSLPREVLAATTELPADNGMAPSSPTAPDARVIAAAADILENAEAPLVITASAGRDPAAVPILAAFADRYGIGVAEFRPRYVNLPSDHPMHLGFEAGPHLGAADAVVVLDCDVPWIPAAAAPSAGCKVIHAGTDPLFARYPLRGFRSDLTVACCAAAFLGALDAELAARPLDQRKIAARRDRVREQHEAMRRSSTERLMDDREKRPISFAWASHCLGAALRDRDAILVNEYPLVRTAIDITRPGSWFGSSPVGGLGWGLPAALGAKLAAKAKLVVATIGDGAYLFANPAVCHQISAANNLPILTVVFNNSAWAAVERATKAMYPEGEAVSANAMPLVSLEPSPAYERLIESYGGWGVRVEDPGDLEAALARAIAVVEDEGRQALINVICR